LGVCQLGHVGILYQHQPQLLTGAGGGVGDELLAALEVLLVTVVGVLLYFTVLGDDAINCIYILHEQ